MQSNRPPFILEVTACFFVENSVVQEMIFEDLAITLDRPGLLSHSILLFRTVSGHIVPRCFMFLIRPFAINVQLYSKKMDQPCAALHPNPTLFPLNGVPAAQSQVSCHLNARHPCIQIDKNFLLRSIEILSSVEPGADSLNSPKALP